MNAPRRPRREPKPSRLERLHDPAVKALIVFALVAIALAPYVVFVYATTLGQEAILNRSEAVESLIAGGLISALGFKQGRDDRPEPPQ